MGGIWATWRFRVAKNILLRYPRWPPQQPFEDLLLLARVSLCHGLLTMVRPSSICPSVTFHIFNISIRVISMMAAMAAILKIFSCYLLPNSKSDGRHRGSMEILNYLNGSILIFKLATMAAIMKIFKLYLLPNGKSD